MKVWFQRADFSSIDFSFQSVNETIKFWKAIDIQKEDAFLGENEKLNGDYCPWGLGISMDANWTIFIYREDIPQNTFLVELEKTVIAKYFGIFPYKKLISKIYNNVSHDTVPDYINMYFNKESYEDLTPR